MTLESSVQGIEYSQHLSHWKAAFQQFYGTQQQPHHGEADAAQGGTLTTSATLSDGTHNPYSAVLTGLQNLLDGPLFKTPQTSRVARAVAAAVDQAPGQAVEQEQAPGIPLDAAQPEEEADGETASLMHSNPGLEANRHPNKRQAGPSQIDLEGLAAEQEEGDSPTAAATTPASRQPPSKRRRNTQAAGSGMPPPPPSTNSLNDLAALAAAVADEECDDPVLGDQQLLQDQAELGYGAAVGSAGGGSIAAHPAGTGVGSARAARGSAARGSRQRTPAPSSSGADEGDSLGVTFPLVNEDGKPLTKQQIKRLRRQQSNRESARRSRQRKAEEANMLAQRVGDLEVTVGALTSKNTGLTAEVQQLRSIVDMLTRDSSTLIAQVEELGGTVPADVAANLQWLAAARATAGWASQPDTTARDGPRGSMAEQGA